ncbi:hypothetical protein [Nibricoccus sp. IMCC34717]|uniref:hypothetical protein n=1 Tax=Nibricoccus sp. IMCC34717 TaxID=3034021 RepID=UPI0038515F38
MDLNPTTDHISITVVAAGIAVGALTTAVWRVANFIRDVRDELRGVQTQLKRGWTCSQQERWAHLLERKNRGLGLFVPSVNDIEEDHPSSPL